MEDLESGVCEVKACEFVNHVGGGFGLTPDILDERMYLLLQVQVGIPCQQKVPGAPMGQERGAENGVYQI